MIVWETLERSWQCMCVTCSVIFDNMYVYMYHKVSFISF